MARAITGTLIRKVDCQLELSNIMPAISGPAAMAKPAVPAHKVIALARSARGKVAASRESVAGMMSAAPTPITARAAMTPAALSTSEPC
jgi:hypothetical protein